MTMATDILFINPGNHRATYQGLSKEYTAIAPPAWACLLAGRAVSRGFSAAIHDVNIEGWDEASAGKVLAGHKPSVIAVMVYGHHPSASTQTMPSAAKIISDLKSSDPGAVIAIGGTHPSALPELTLRETRADYVVVGEGAFTLDGLLECAKGKRRHRDVPGLCYRDGGSARLTPPAPAAQDLDSEFPDYAWDLLPANAGYRAHNMHCFQDFGKSSVPDFSDVRTPYLTINTSLGCPYSCDYCCINATFGKPGIRYWSPEKVLGWIDTAVTRYKVRNIRFEDELFILSPQRVERICDMIIERGYDLNLWAYGRVDTIHAPLLKKLKKAGMNWLCLGIESGNERVRGDVNKHIKGDIRGVVDAVRAHDIYVLGNYMFGLPEDDMSTMEETLALAMELNCEFANFYTVMPYPGSKFYAAAEKAGTLPPSWEAYSQHGYETTPMPTRHLTAAQVLDFRDRAFVKYHSNEKYLAMIKGRFGAPVRAHIEKLLTMKVRRRILEETHAPEGK